MALLSTSSRLIKVGQDYSAGSGISINDHVISVTGEFGKVYSAGENISIDDNVINSKDWTEDIANASANAYNQATAQIPEPFDPSYLSGEIDNKLNSTAFTTWQNGQYSTDLQTIEGQITNKLDASSFSDVSASFLTAINIPESATWNEVSQAYEQASGTYLTAHQSLDGYATEQWVEDKGYLTEVSIPESASWNETTTVVQSNSAQWGEGGSGDEEVNELVHSNSAAWNEVSSKLDESTFQEASGLFLTAIPQEYITESDIPNFISAKLDTTAFADVSGSFLTAVNIPESATWNETTNVVQSNSAQWAEGGSTSGFVSGLNTLFVPSYPGASDGKVYSANISGDVAVSTGYYYNSGANIDILRTYSLSSMCSQLENKLDKSFIENSKTLSMISNTAEVYAIGYKPTEFITTGITIRNYSNDHHFSFYISPNDYLYSANFVVESDGFDTNRIPSDWIFVNSANGSASFCKYYKDGVQSDNTDYFDPHHTITNASAYVVAHKSRVIDALAFKSDLTGGAGDTEVNELVNTNSATWNTVTDKLDTTAQVITGFTTASIEGNPLIISLNGTSINAYRAVSAQEAGVANNARYDYEGNNLVNDHNSLTSLKDFVQNNSANYIPYSASGVELPNSNFKIDTSGQAYKLGSVSGSVPLEFGEVIAGFPDGALTELENGVTYTLTIQGTQDNSMIMFVNLNTQSPYADRPTITNNQCTFTWTYEDASVGILDYYGKIDSTSTTLTYTKNTEKRYVLEDDLEQVSADITATIPSTAGLASESYVQTNSAVLTAMIAEKQDTLTFGYDEQDRISAINNSALAGGGDVPEDVMVETGLEYNAVNEISGYNGSAIAQYGAEKQWLVHDDTIVHVANSAQYAFGCNVSALQRLMGIDETVLFDNSGNVGKANISAYTLSESVNNFDRLRISFARGQGFYGDQCFEYNVNTYPKMVSLNCYDPSSPSAYRYFCSFTISGSEFTELAGKCGFSQIIGGSLTTTSNNWLHPYKIVGIGRKA